MTIAQLQANIASQLAQAGISSARLDAELILAHTVGQNRAWLISHAGDHATSDLINQVTQYAKLRASRQPLSYVLNYREFYGLNFYVDERVLTPRVETELMIDKARELIARGGRVLDIGTGCGALAITLAKNRPDLKIVASDVSPLALQVAKLNAKSILGDKSKIDFVRSDLFSKLDGKFDAILANLPYVAQSGHLQILPEVEHEPDVALFGGQDGYDLYQQFFSQVSEFLNRNALVLTESDPWQHAQLSQFASLGDLTNLSDDYFIQVFKN